MREFGLIGYPLGHSFSKKFFSEKFEKENISDCNYELFPIPSIHELPGLIKTHPDLRGLNITIPYKKEVIQYLDDSSHLPAALNACNCIDIKDGKLLGYNTDIVGFEKSFLTQLKPYHNRALVLGTGGAAAAVLHVLKKLGIDYSMVSRRRSDQVHFTYEDISAEIIKDHPVIINTTPLGTFPNTNECPAIHYEAVGATHYLFDLVYNPARTLFLQKGDMQGASIQNGYDMLVYQAEEAWRIWNA